MTGPSVYVTLSLSLRDQMIKERLVNGHGYRVPAFLHSTDMAQNNCMPFREIVFTKTWGRLVRHIEPKIRSYSQIEPNISMLICAEPFQQREIIELCEWESK